MISTIDIINEVLYLIDAAHVQLLHIKTGWFKDIHQTLESSGMENTRTSL